MHRSKGKCRFGRYCLTDVFFHIEGQAGYFVDGPTSVHASLVTDPDSLVNGKIYEVSFITQNNNLQIALKETTDTTPQINETILVNAGIKYKGKMFYYDGTAWKQGQDKIQTNQQPLFDMYNDSGTALNTLSGSTFRNKYYPKLEQERMIQN